MAHEFESRILCVVSEGRKQYIREYQRRWIAQRRRDWIDANGPCAKCGSWDELEVDHKDASTKVFNPSYLWSLAVSNPKRIAELAKCWVLCKTCHNTKTTISGERACGQRIGSSKLNERDVARIRILRKKGATLRGLGELFNVDQRAISAICKRETWKHVP